MAIYELRDLSLKEIEKTTFQNEKILERSHLQAAIKKRVEIIAPDCLVVAEELSEWEDSQRRIDLFGIDRDGNIVVIELKRTETGELMELQALRYAAMVSTLTLERTIEIFQRYINENNLGLNAKDEILHFLEWDDIHEEDFALDVRIILVSGDFSKELTTSVLWLRDKGIDIRCVRLLPYKNGEQILIDVDQVIPLPEAEDYQVRIREKTERKRDSHQDNKDYTQYSFNGLSLNKRKLVLAVILKWCSENRPTSIQQLVSAFPQELHAGKLFISYESALEIYNKQGIARHFLGDNEIIALSDNSKYAFSNQWGVGNIENFIRNAQRLGYEIE